MSHIEALTNVTPFRRDRVQARTYRVRWSLDTPMDVVKEAISVWTDEVSAAIPGVVYFSMTTEIETLPSGRKVRSARLYADDRAWAAFRARGSSFRPKVDRRLAATGNIARPADLRQLFSAPMQTAAHG